MSSASRIQLRPGTASSPVPVSYGDQEPVPVCCPAWEPVVGPPEVASQGQ